ncbi:hypothetical protein CRYUN_Cryun21dG0073100 [Craigia yunnanensis]
MSFSISYLKTKTHLVMILLLSLRSALRYLTISCTMSMEDQGRCWWSLSRICFFL